MTIVCIAGMHRSGTSLVSRLLNLCGVYLGKEEELMPPTQDNADGYWENLGFVEINDRLLAQLNGTWALPPPADSILEMQKQPLIFTDKVQELIQGFDGQKIWGWKDPRNSLTLPFWQQLLPGLKVIMCLRNPLEVARSLARRDKFQIMFGLELWHTYNQRLLSAVAPANLLTTHYDTYFNAPQDELHRLLEFIGIQVDKQQVEMACVAAKRPLKHNRHTLEDLIAEGAPWKVIDLYAQLCSQAGPVFWDGIKNNVSDLTETGEGNGSGIEYGLLQRLVDKDPIVPVLAAHIAKDAQAVQALNAQIGEKEQEIQLLSAQVTANEQATQTLSVQASKNEQQGKALSTQFQDNQVVKRYDTCVILHLYYPNMWSELLPYFSSLDKQFDLIITIPYEVKISEHAIKANFPDAQIYRCENRGRDVLPFLTVLSVISKLDYKYICKIHTKQNISRNGINWREDVLDKLLGSHNVVSNIKKALDDHPDWGLVAPKGYVFPNNAFWRNNANKVINLARFFNLPTDDIKFSFVAGTMFWFRPQVFSLLTNLDALPLDFEPEQGQRDGGLSHAYERFFGMVATYAGFKIAESDLQKVRLSSDASLPILLLAESHEDQMQSVQLLSAQVKESEWVAHAYSTQVVEIERITQAYTAQVAETERITQAYSAQVAETERITQAYTAQVAEQENIIKHLENVLAEKNTHINSLDISINSIYQSTSWKITRPLRDIKTLVQKILISARSMVWRIGSLIYHVMPASYETKRRIKDAILRRFGFVSKFQPVIAPALPTVQESNNFTQLEAIVGYDLAIDNKITFPLIRIADRRKISVIVTSYNHERYIKQCLDSILDQKGDFNVEIILGDDCSTDKTREIMQQYYEMYPDIIKLLPQENNLGITKNLKRCLDACSGNYIAICEGDDYWINKYKLQKQMEYLEVHKDYSMCFSSIMLFYEDENKFLPFSDQVSLNKNVITTEDLIQSNYIGNFSCCMYRADAVRKLPKEIFEVFTVDWMFNMACGEVGKIGFIRDYMSVYRKHSSGLWSGNSATEQAEKLLPLLEAYDKFLNNKYHKQFKRLQLNLEALYLQHDLLILDTLFPQPLSPFRYQEFISYMDHFSSALVLTTGEHLPTPALQETRQISEVITEFEIEHPEYLGRVVITAHNLEPYKGKLAYIVFLYNASVFLSALEMKNIPFIFTLYPGGGFRLNVPESDDMLRRVTSSPYFRKVIVTQKITYDYLISKSFCRPDQIEFIYGVVTPLDLLNNDLSKKNFGFEKNTLDICFVAHKYMEAGIDKGYDIFIETARKLTATHPNICFHVVGDFTEADLSIEGLEGRIVFYGPRKKQWLQDFYIDKDIILSPNIPFTVMKGSFDGFPTASCTEAGLRKVAIFCTDELHLNMKFIDGVDLDIIPHDSEKIVKLIEFYYSNPDKLKKLAETGSATMRGIYSYENQILPRIRIIEAELGKETE